MDDVALNYNAFLSVNGRTFSSFNSQDFQLPSNPVITSANVSYLGTIGWTFTGNNALGNFDLNIHAGAAIQTFTGTNPPLPGAVSNQIIPIRRY